jgi:multidrug efflux pump subunit AcrA (membrane-fusion protein)
MLPVVFIVISPDTYGFHVNKPLHVDYHTRNYFEKMTRKRRSIALDAHRANHRPSQRISPFHIVRHVHSHCRGECPVFSVARLPGHVALFEVSDLHRVRIYVQVPQAFSADLRPGLKATFEMPQYPGRKFDATLVTTSNAVNAMARSTLVELQADNPDGKLFGGTYCRVDFQIPGDPNMVRLPATALMPVNRGVQVAVLGDSNKVVLKSIQLGRDFGDTVEVTAGLAPQDRVIDSPPETLQTGDTVQIAAPTPSSTATQAGAPASPATQ